jgi:glycine/D-amino acid oxidase-like deaminating enzyme
VSVKIFDTIVVGGGLVGSAIAYGLAKRDQSVLILDQGDIAFRASRGNFGLVWVQGKGNGLPAYSQWSLKSARVWPELAASIQEDTGIDVNLNQPGGIHFFLNETERDARDKLLKSIASAAGAEFSHELIDQKAVRDLFPHVSDAIIGAASSPHDGACNSLRLFRGLHAGFQSRGGTYESNQTVVDIQFQNPGFMVKTQSDSFTSARVVLAAGLGTRELAPKVGLNAPVSPLKGQIMVTAKIKPFLNRPTHFMRQTDEGGVIIGESKEDVGFDDRTTPSVMHALAKRAGMIFPMLRDVNVVRTWGALRVMTPDGAPVYQHSETCPGAFMTCVHSGVTLAGAHAGPLADAIAGGALGDYFKPFHPERFNVPKAA